MDHLDVRKMVFFSSELWSVVTLSFACGRFTDGAEEVFSDDADSDNGDRRLF